MWWLLMYVRMNVAVDVDKTKNDDWYKSRKEAITYRIAYKRMVHPWWSTALEFSSFMRTFLCASFTHSFIPFDWIRNIISSDSPASQSFIQSVSQPIMLKHLTERQNHNLIERSQQPKNLKKKVCRAQLCTHVKQIQQEKMNIHSLTHSLSLLLINIQWATDAVATDQISAIVAIFRKFVPKTMWWWNPHATKLESHFYIHSYVVDTEEDRARERSWAMKNDEKQISHTHLRHSCNSKIG